MRIEEVILGQAWGKDHVRLVCPECAPNRKRHHQTLTTLSVDYRDGAYVYLCQHCGARGAIKERNDMQPQEILPEVRPALASVPKLVPLTQTCIDWLASRGISKETAEKCGVMQSVRWFRNLGKETMAIAFPYPGATKFRSIEGKDFNCIGSPSTMWLGEKIKPDEVSCLLITEGELDALTAAECGLAAVSVPSGAGHALHREIEPSQDRQFRYLWAAEKLLNGVKKIVIAVDKDTPGEALGAELARRIGRDRVWLPQLPEGIKDLNEYFLKYGKESSRNLIEEAKPWPVVGLHEAMEFGVEVEQLYQHGLPRGLSTGWRNLDDLLSIKQGLLHVVTGVPASGKTTWVNNLLVNLAKAKQIKTCFASFELQPSSIHIAQLAAQYLGLPFGSQSSFRMTAEQMHQAVEWVNDHFIFLSQQEPPTVKSVLERWRAAVMRKGVRACVLDPANFLRFPDAPSGPEPEALSQALAEFKTFALANDCAVFIIAHPRKPDTLDSGWVPGGYSIAGTAAYYNRCDIGITIQRRHGGSAVHIWKSRFGHLAQHGVRDLDFDPICGRFTEPVQGGNDGGDPFDL